MTPQDKTKLFNYLDQELDVVAFESDLDEIERIATDEDRRLLALAKGEIEALYEPAGIKGETALLKLINARLALFPPQP